MVSLAILFTAFVGGVLNSRVTAWSSNSPSSSNTDRRQFIATANKAAAAIAGAGTVGVYDTVIGHRSQVAAAATTTTGIYQPAPASLAGQVHLITGASTGLGLESAKRLAAAGATVVMTTRSEAKGEKAKSQVYEYLAERSIVDNAPEIYIIPLELNDFSSVRAFPERYKSILGLRKIDVLMNNAGAQNGGKYEMTKDGYERTFQGNHLGPFLLTSLLFPYLNRTAGARVINVSSKAHQYARMAKTGASGLDMNNLNGELSYGADGWEAYINTKLENVLFTEELQRRADAAGLTWLTTVALHPGVVGTDIWRKSLVAKSQAMPLKALASSLFYRSVITVEEGANTQIMLAAEKKIAKGKYYDEYGRVKELAPFAMDPFKAKELWEVSENLVGSVFKVE